MIFAKEEVGSFCGIHIPVRETTETTTCCEIPLPPSPLMPQTNLPHILRTIGLYTICVYPNVHKCRRDRTSTCTFGFLCVTLHASWVVPAPGVRGVLHFQLRRELGLLCGSTPAKSEIYCLQKTGRDWQCFLKNLLTPRRETTTSPTASDSPCPEISKPKSLDKRRQRRQVRHGRADRFRMHLILRSVFVSFCWLI